MTLQLNELSTIRARHHDQKLILTSGTFDLFHVGHLHYLLTAKSYGDVLIVLLSGDDRVKARKGNKRPIYPEKERSETLEALSAVDYVLLDSTSIEDEQFYKKIIDTLQPDLYVTDGPDPRFIHILEKDRFVVLPRVESGVHSSTSAIIEYIHNL